MRTREQLLKAIGDLNSLSVEITDEPIDVFDPEHGLYELNKLSEILEEFGVDVGNENITDEMWLKIDKDLRGMFIGTFIIHLIEKRKNEAVMT